MQAFDWMTILSSAAPDYETQLFEREYPEIKLA